MTTQVHYYKEGEDMVSSELPSNVTLVELMFGEWNKEQTTANLCIHRRRQNYKKDKC